MRLLIVCFLALVGWVASAPGSLSSSSSSSSTSTSTSNNDNPEDLQQESEDDNLAPALNDLARRKRGSGKSNLPYSNYRPSSGMHRYRYPLYRKRSYRPQPSYDYEEEVMLPEVGSDYLEYDNQVRGPSLFRERSLQQQQQDRRKKEMLFEDDGYFSDDYVPEKSLLPSPFMMPLKKDSPYNLVNSPYDLHTIGRMYEMGKRDDASGSPLGPSPYDIEALNQIHSVGRKSPPRMSPTEEFYDAIDSIKKKKAMFDDRFINPLDATEKMEHLLKLKNFLSSAAGSRYLGDHNGQNFNARDPMIRKKRDTSATNPNIVTKTNSTMTRKNLASTVPARYQQTQLSGDRRKRAFNDYFNWERKALASEYQPMEKRSSSNKDFNDFLTREYFKSIARSVGQKKKRMAYAQFEADKKSSGIDEFLENPSMLQYMQSKLKEAEEEVAGEAEKELGEGDSDTKELLSNIVVRLDALERMREALGRLEELQNEEAQEESARRAVSNGLSAASKKRQSSNISSSSSSTGVAASKKRSDGSRKKQKKSAVDGRRIRRMRRGEESSLQAAFMGNSKEECPVLERILLNCVSVSEIVGDQDLAFLEPCIRHEVCYMCGSGLSVSGHECDAILSSSLEAACSGNLDCLSAAGDTFNLLSNAERYDDNGTCTHDPCVRQFLESR